MRPSVPDWRQSALPYSRRTTATSCLEKRDLLLGRLPEMDQDATYRAVKEPRGQLEVPLKSRQFSEHLQKYISGKVFGLNCVVRDTQADVIDPRLVSVKHSGERFAVPVLKALHHLEVFEIPIGVQIVSSFALLRRKAAATVGRYSFPT